MLRAALATLKLHRFEWSMAVLLGTGAGLWAIWLWFRVAALNIPSRCIDDWLIDGPATRPDCAGQMQQFAELMGAGAEPYFAAMGIVPFLAGLLAGTPIVARELEAGTSQTTWWLNPSRISWLLRQLTVLGVPLLVVMTIAAVAADLVVGLDIAWGQSAFVRVGLHGALVVARAWSTFGLGLLIGIVVGRALPGVVCAAAVATALAISISFARDTWVRNLEPTVVGVPSPVTGELEVEPRAVQTGWGWRGPDGTISRHEVAGYETVLLGVSDASALAWEPIETASYGGVGSATLLLSLLVVRRRRAT
jgi:hypothetical protein